MIESILPYIYIAGAAFDVLLVGTAALVAYGASPASRWPMTLALFAASLTWGTVAFVMLNPADVAWLHVGELTVWIPLSAICAALVWNSRPPAREETPAPPPPAYPKINGQFRPPSETAIAADLLRRTYRKRGA